MVTIKTARYRAVCAQNYRCFYCSLPVWCGEPDAFAERHHLSRRAARPLQCTAEHLVARKDGGGNGACNIVAACMWCNRRRHARRKELSLHDYQALVKRRVAAGKWHTADLLRLMRG
jgi:5-methylcytosine-specific restriction endonuclease McrA